MTRPKELNLVVDLDGTLATVNTFRLWTYSIFLMESPTNLPDRLTAACVFFRSYGRRLLGITTHTDLRREFIVAWGERMSRVGSPIGARHNERFARMVVSRRLNSSVTDLIDRLKATGASQRVLLATAAPEFYARHIAESLGMELCATPVTDESLASVPHMMWQANVGPAKLQAVQEVLGGAEYIVITDSEDDFPLIEGAEDVYLVKPKASLVARIEGSGKSWTLVP